MNRHYLAYKSTTEPFNYQESKSKNPVGIVEINFVWDHQKKHLIAIMKSDHKFNQELIVLLKGNRLILEAPHISVYDQLYGTTLIKQRTRRDMEMESLDIVFSEVELKPGFDYTLISYEVIDPCLFKVTLGYRSMARSSDN